MSLLLYHSFLVWYALGTTICRLRCLDDLPLVIRGLNGRWFLRRGGGFGEYVPQGGTRWIKFYSNSNLTELLITNPVVQRISNTTTGLLATLVYGYKPSPSDVVEDWWRRPWDRVRLGRLAVEWRIQLLRWLFRLTTLCHVVRWS